MGGVNGDRAHGAVARIRVLPDGAAGQPDELREIGRDRAVAALLGHGRHVQAALDAFGPPAIHGPVLARVA